MRERLQRWFWPTLAVLTAVVPVAGGLSASRLLHYRDLSSYVWPYHLWMRRTIASGRLPLWNDDVACGYAAIADPTL